MTTPYLAAAWTDFWNGETSLAHEICTPDFTIWLGRAESAANSLSGPGAFAAFVDGFRADRPGLRYSAVHAIPAESTLTLLWNADMGDLHVGGIDVLHLNDAGRIVRAHSVTGEHPVILHADDETR